MSSVRRCFLKVNYSSCLPFIVRADATKATRLEQEQEQEQVVVDRAARKAVTHGELYVKPRRDETAARLAVAALFITEWHCVNDYLVLSAARLW